MRLTGEEAGVGTSVAGRHAESLTGAQGDVHSKLSGRFQDGQRHQIGGTADQSLTEAKGQGRVAVGQPQGRWSLEVGRYRESVFDRLFIPESSAWVLLMWETECDVKCQ